MLERKQIAVTGGAGFIGTSLCRALVARGYSVLSMDVVRPVTPVSGVVYENIDVRHFEKTAAALYGSCAVVHLAAMVSVPECQERPVDSHLTNVMGTAVVLEAARHESARSGMPVRVLLASSSAVYGELGNRGNALTERDVLEAPISFYGAQKLAAEHLMRLYYRVHGVPGVVFRFFNVFGEGQRADSPYCGVISVFRSRILNGKPLILNGGGIQTRDFIPVSNVVDGILRALRLQTDACDALPINLGTGRAVSIAALSQSMMNALGITVNVESAPARSGDILHSRANIDRAFQILEWCPTGNFEHALQSYVCDGPRVEV